MVTTCVNPAPSAIRARSCRILPGPGLVAGAAKDAVVKADYGQVDPFPDAAITGRIAEPSRLPVTVDHDHVSLSGRAVAIPRTDGGSLRVAAQHVEVLRPVAGCVEFL